jgi:hypothetical protein
MRAAVDAVLAPISQSSPITHAAQLRHLEPAAGVHRQAEAVGAQHRAGMHQHALAQADARDQGHAGDSSLPAPTTQSSPITQPAPITAPARRGCGADADEGPMRVGIDRRCRSTARHGCRRARAAWLEQRADFGERDIGIARDQRVPEAVGVAARITTIAGRLSASWLRYCGLARNASCAVARRASVPRPRRACRRRAGPARSVGAVRRR